MCGIAGIIYRNGGGERQVGRDMTAMLQAMKHRGPDSTGYALYRGNDDSFVMHVKLSEADRERRRHRPAGEAPARPGRGPDRGRGRAQIDEIKHARDDDGRPSASTVTSRCSPTPSSGCATPRSCPSGAASRSSRTWATPRPSRREYGLDKFTGTHAIGHARMATESDVDIANAHPYWAYPFPDVAVVHNGQLTNFHDWRRRLTRAGHRFQSDCDSEIIAVYLAEKMSKGKSLEDAMRDSLEELDGVFTYICVTEDALGVAKDVLGAKPLVLYEDDELVALASEEIAIRQVLDREIETHDPYEGEVKVWSR